MCACVRAFCRMGVSDILILVCESDLAYGGGLGKPKTVGRSEMTYGGENVGSIFKLQKMVWCVGFITRSQIF